MANVTMNDKEFNELVDKITAPLKPTKSGVSLSFPYDLRASLDMKAKDCSPWHRWTAFLNNAGNLCHVVSPESEILVRIKFSLSIKHISAERQLSLIVNSIKHYVQL